MADDLGHLRTAPGVRSGTFLHGWAAGKLITLVTYLHTRPKRKNGVISQERVSVGYVQFSLTTFCKSEEYTAFKT